MTKLIQILIINEPNDNYTLFKRKNRRRKFSGVNLVNPNLNLDSVDRRPTRYYCCHRGLCKSKALRSILFLDMSRDVNKDLTPKDQDKDKDLTPKDKDLTPRTRTRTSNMSLRSP